MSTNQNARQVGLQSSTGWLVNELPLLLIALNLSLIVLAFPPCSCWWLPHHELHWQLVHIQVPSSTANLILSVPLKVLVRGLLEKHWFRVWIHNRAALIFAKVLECLMRTISVGCVFAMNYSISSRWSSAFSCWLADWQKEEGSLAEPWHQKALPLDHLMDAPNNGGATLSALCWLSVSGLEDECH